MTAIPALLSIEAVSKLYPGMRLGLFSRAAPIKVLDDVSLEVEAGEIVALVGESGSGKSTLARLAANLLSPSAGRVAFEGIAHEDRGRARALDLCRQVQLIQQDASGSLDPRMAVGAQLCEILEIHGWTSPRDRRARTFALLEEVGLAAEMFDRLPHRLSGGQRQRVVIARALTVDPRLLICDEPVSSLDVTVQAQIVELLLSLRSTRGTALLFITHDLELARRIADRVAVMVAGRLVEVGKAADVLGNPRHDYTRELIAAALPRKRVPSAPMRERRTP